MRTDSRWVIVVLAVLGSVGAGAGEVPIAVSPGDASKLALIGDPCPTFSWDAVERATAHELVVYKLGEEGQEAEVVLRRQVSGAASSWTPSLDQCLERGGQYVWSVRAVGRKEASDWSAPSLFEVASGLSEAEFEQAFKLLRQYLVTQSGAGPAGVAEADAEVESEPRREASTASPTPAAVGTTQLSVDGGVVATSFTGDGSTLTGLTPTNLSAAVPVSKGGTGATTPGDARANLGAASQVELSNHAASSDHDTRYYTETEIQTSGSATVHWDNLTGVPPNVADTTSGDAVAGEIVKDKKAWVDGGEVTGTKVRFQDNGDGTVTDNDTNLIWLKDAGCLGLSQWSSGPGLPDSVPTKIADLNDTGVGSDFGCTDYTEGTFTDWRVPHVGELWSLIDMHHVSPALSDAAGTGQWSAGDTFTGVPLFFCWSATMGNSGVFAVDLTDGELQDFEDYLGPRYVWPVRDP